MEILIFLTQVLIIAIAIYFIVTIINNILTLKEKIKFRANDNLERIIYSTVIVNMAEYKKVTEGEGDAISLEDLLRRTVDEVMCMLTTNELETIASDGLTRRAYIKMRLLASYIDMKATIR